MTKQIEDQEKWLVHDACLELEHGASTPQEAVKLAKKHPGRWFPGSKWQTPVSTAKQD